MFLTKTIGPHASNPKILLREQAAGAQLVTSQLLQSIRDNKGKVRMGRMINADGNPGEFALALGDFDKLGRRVTKLGEALIGDLPDADIETLRDKVRGWGDDRLDDDFWEGLDDVRSRIGKLTRTTDSRRGCRATHFWDGLGQRLGCARHSTMGICTAWPIPS